MFIDIKLDFDHENVLVCGTHIISFRKMGDAKDIEVVIHPNNEGSVSVRTAREPYVCTLTLDDGSEIRCDLSEPEDWGNIETETMECGWGNDLDGCKKVVKVRCGCTEIPLREFVKDVSDFIVFHEA